ncbi:MAG: cupredoxin domain-containing protein [Thermoanaerobacterales bacterium]|jgi:plastocyanin|nr:cupredoxin domain-containing protein [Thermoanaerobacterales bacterium]
MRRAVLLPLLVALAGAACGDGDDGARVSSEPVPDDPDVVIVAEDMAFAPDEVEVPAGEPVTIVIDNRDEGVNHNIHVEGSPEPDRTPLELGPSQQALTVTLPAGTYGFVCDIHPGMTGTVVAR